MQKHRLFRTLQYLSIFLVGIQGTCPPGWTRSPHSVSCIKVYTYRKTWHQAKYVCAENGGDLVSILDDKMREFVWDQIKADAAKRYWIGLNDIKQQGVFKWLDETGFEPIFYHQWALYEPNGDGTHDCVYFTHVIPRGMLWADDSCYKQEKFICDIFRVQGVCPFNVTNDYCMKLHKERKAWFGARKTCKDEGGDLVKILDESKKNSILDLINLDTASQKQTQERYWIGLNDIKHEGNFTWGNSQQQ
ncbi:hypothetical protein EGW08_017118, partial [Elysia chlorotica]